MTFPLLLFANEYCGFKKQNESAKTRIAILVVGSLAFDTCASLTCLVVGVLGAVGVIGMPIGAAYALIGVSGSITLLWVALALRIVRVECSSKKIK